jgi:TPP-dependent pyruvate/acetoin dehydrogenase alpha subunit
VSPAQLAAAETAAVLDVDQELILIRRFEDAMASLAQEGKDGAVAALFSRQEFERSSRIATNMRGHIR